MAGKTTMNENVSPVKIVIFQCHVSFQGGNFTIVDFFGGMRESITHLPSLEGEKICLTNPREPEELSLLYGFVDILAGLGLGRRKPPDVDTNVLSNSCFEAFVEASCPELF